jgi:DNA-binding NtrC family response regulator
MSRDAREWLLAYSWPGNVRELRNAIERAILLCDRGLITHEHLPAPMVRLERSAGGNGAPTSNKSPTNDGAPASTGAPSNGASALPLPEGVDLAAMERSFIERALNQSKGNKSQAARLLGLTRAQLYWRLDKHGIR